MHIRCPQSFEDLKFIGNNLFGSFREAALYRGLLESDDYAENCLAEAIHYQMPCSLRRLFAMLLVYGVTPNPQALWDKYYSAFSEDFARFGELSEAQLLKKTILSIDKFLLSMDKSISDFSLRFSIPYSSVGDKMSKEYEYEQTRAISEEDLLSRNLLNADQTLAFNMIVSKINSGEWGFFCGWAWWNWKNLFVPCIVGNCTVQENCFSYCYFRSGCFTVTRGTNLSFQV